MYYFIVLVIVVLIVIWYYCQIRNWVTNMLNVLFPPCDNKKIEISIPTGSEEFKDDISKHINFTDSNLQRNLY